nr:MAG TPA: protein of unknown function (DUF4760) [Caudoviricetes sp.]
MRGDVNSMISVVVSVIAFLFSIYSFWHSRKISRHTMLIEYYIEENTEEKINARREIYSMSKEDMADLTKDDAKRAWMSSYYQFYASLYFRGVLDKKTFQEIFGWAAVKLYHQLEPYIYARRAREGDNRNYAWKFQKLVEDIERCEMMGTQKDPRMS